MTSALRVLIVDDEAPAREGLRLRLRREQGVTVLGEYGEPHRALTAIREDPPDILFVDIQMAGMDGFALLEQAADVVPIIIFVTAHHEHAVRAFAASAFDYLLKPVEQQRLNASIARARRQLEMARKGEMTDRVAGLIAQLSRGGAPTDSAPAARSAARIPIRMGDSILLLPVDEIDYIEASGDSVRIHAGAKDYSVRMTMGAIQARLDRDFLRIHRSTIVNVTRIRQLEPYFHGEYLVVLVTGAKLKLSRGYREAVAARLGF
jgi:two-component system LytT family response regulator